MVPGARSEIRPERSASEAMVRGVAVATLALVIFAPMFADWEMDSGAAADHPVPTRKQPNSDRSNTLKRNLQLSSGGSDRDRGHGGHVRNRGNGRELSQAPACGPSPDGCAHRVF